MTATTLEHPTDRSSPSGRLRSTMCATRVNFTWLGTQKTLTPAQRAQAALSFDAQGEFLSAGKKLLDTKNPRFKAVTSERNRIRSFWTSMSLPYPEPAVRLIRQDRVDTFQDWMSEHRQELIKVVEELDEDYCPCDGSKTLAFRRIL